MKKEQLSNSESVKHTVEEIKALTSRGDWRIDQQDLKRIATEEGDTPLGRLALFAAQNIDHLREEWIHGKDYQTGYEEVSEEFDRLEELAREVEK